jgi:hypothetical protein
VCIAQEKDAVVAGVLGAQAIGAFSPMAVDVLADILRVFYLVPDDGERPRRISF